MVNGSIIDISPHLRGVISSPQNIVGRLSRRSPRLKVKISVSAIRPPEYDGPYTFTPNESSYIFNTSGKMVGNDIVIDPIPDNYARMSWDGTVLHFY